jgi:hypothetical protein
VNKLIAILLLMTATSCSKNMGASKYAGSWSGSYSTMVTATYPPYLDTGSLLITVDAKNNATGILQPLRGGMPAKLQGTVSPASGTISMSEHGIGNDGANVFLEGLNGNLSMDSANGTLTFPWATASRWQAIKN